MTNPPLAQKILAYADDSLILGHRDSEWAGHAPILEEDIGFANLALDELGHAQLWYDLHQELTGALPDETVYFRDESEWRCAPFVELPKGDWAFSMTRQYLFDVYENVLLEKLMSSREARVAGIAAKIRSEEIYHLRHTSNWVKRLGLGTEESRTRMNRALDKLWSYALQFVAPMEGEQELIAAGIVPDSKSVRDEWEAKTRAHLTASGLQIPESQIPIAYSRTRHTAYLAELLADMQSVARSEKFGVEW